MESAIVWQCPAVETLRLASPVEEDVSDSHDDVVDDATSCNEVDKPFQDLLGAVTELQE